MSKDTIEDLIVGVCAWRTYKWHCPNCEAENTTDTDDVTAGQEEHCFNCGQVVGLIIEQEDSK